MSSLVARSFRRRIPAAALLLLAAGATGPAACGPPAEARADSGGRHRTPAADAADAADAAGEAPPVPVRVAPAAEVARPDSVRAGGVVEARAASELAFQVGGRLVAVPVDEGTRVARGQLVAAVDPTDYRLALRNAELVLARAEDDRRRAEPLRAAGAIAPVDYDRLLSGARQAAVARDLAATRLAHTRLLAPFAGVVARKGAEVGATAAVGTPLFTLVDLDEVRVRAGVPEGDVGRLRAGQGAAVALEAAPDAFGGVGGTVHTVGVAADPASRTYPVTVRVPNRAHALRPGMVATVAVATGASASAGVVPAAAVARDADGVTRVYVLDRAAGRARARRVDVGAAPGAAPGDTLGTVAVARGLAAGEPVVVAGAPRLRDGARVTVVGDDRPVADRAAGGRAAGGRQPEARP